MNIKLVQIGNSKGVRIPKKILDRCQVEGSLDLSVENESIILRPVKKVSREGWDVAAKEMHGAGDDQLLIPDVFEDDTELDW